MNLRFAPNDTTKVHVYSHAGAWYVELKTATDVTCSHGETFTIAVDYKREVTSNDGDVVLDAFEAALRAAVAETQEQKVQASEGVRQLAAVLTDEAVYFQFTDPCSLS